jgi:hypothetical protein
MLRIGMNFKRRERVRRIEIRRSSPSPTPGLSAFVAKHFSGSGTDSADASSKRNILEVEGDYGPHEREVCFGGQ